MRSTTFVARRPGPFSALVQAAEIGGLALEPLAPVRVHDQYYDTDAGDLLRHGLALRVREQGGQRTAGLRAVGDAGPSGLPADVGLLGGADGRYDAQLNLPPSALDSAVRAVTGDEPLMPLLSLRQYRTPRVARDGAATVGVLSFDVVVYEVPGARVVSNEVEVQPRGGDPLSRLEPVFRDRGLEPAAHSKFERAVLRLARTLDQPALVLPDELRQLEAAVASDDGPRRRRATVVLLDARGFRPDTIAAQTGLSMARVRHWRQRFREVRLGVLEMEPAATPTRRVPPRPAAARPAEPLAESHSLPLPTESLRDAPVSPPEASGGAGAPPVSPPEGDGSTAKLPEDPIKAVDMAELLDLFSPSMPDTPMLGDDDPPDDVTTPATETVFDSRTEAHHNPYPVVLGPVAGARDASGAPRAPEVRAPAFEMLADVVSTTAFAANASAPGNPPVGAHTHPQTPELAASRDPTGEPSRGLASDPFAEINLAALRKRRPLADLVGARAADTPAGRVPQPTLEPSTASAPRPIADRARPPRRGDVPLAEAAGATLGYHLARFEQVAAAFSASQAPSDARRLLIAAQCLRLTVETFAPVLPTPSRLTAALRPLVSDLTAGLDAAGGAAHGPPSPDLARSASVSLASAAARLGHSRHHAWGDRSRRLLAHLGRQPGLRAGDVAATPPDDFVGDPGDVPTASRLRHVLASAIWSRFEAIRAFEDDLGAPTPELAVHLAVALSGLRFVIGLAEPSDASLEVGATLDAAEREVTQARRRALAELSAGPLAVVPDAWAQVTAAPFRMRLAQLTAGI